MHSHRARRHRPHARGGRGQRARAAARARAARGASSTSTASARASSTSSRSARATPTSPTRVERGGAEFVLRRPPRGPLPPSAPRRPARGARAAAPLEGHARVPAGARRLRRRGGHRRAVLRHGARRGRRHHERGARPRSTRPEDRRADRRGARRRARRGARGRLAGGRAGGLRQADRLPRAPAAPLPRAVGAQPHARDPGGRARRRVAARRTCPSRPPATIVHGDFRLGNTMFAAGAPARLVAIFDWEMATIGDPLADVGYLCTLWIDRDDPPLRDVRAVARVTRAGGLPARAPSWSRATRSAAGAR